MINERLRICLVTEFDQNFDQSSFQWYVALKRNSKFSVNSVVMNPSTLTVHKYNTSYWKPLKEADFVFVYCARRNQNREWYMLPLLVKKWMKAEAKMLCQFDLEFLWLWYPQHIHHLWQGFPRWAENKTPEEFLKGIGIMEIADAHIIFFNSMLANYTSKQVYPLPLPQLVRYEKFVEIPSEADLTTKSRKVVILEHHVKSASIKHTLNNVVYPLKIPAIILTKEKALLSRNDYMKLLRRAYVAIDDNEGYYGWSRFAMECALAHVPCIGSTLAVKEFFPELYTEPKDYKKQKELLKKLYRDHDFWLKMIHSGKKLVLEKLDTKRLTNRLFDILVRMKNV